MDHVLGFILTPLVLGFLGGCLTLLGKLLLVDFVAKGYFARKRRELRSYDAIYDSVSMCEMRYSLGWKSEIIDLMNKGKITPKHEQRAINETFKITVIEELMRIHQYLKWLDDNKIKTDLVEWEKNIQLRIERQRKIIEEEKPSEEEDQALKDSPYKEILGYLRKRVRQMARYDY